MKLILADNQEITRWAISELAHQMGLCEEKNILVIHNIYGLKKAVSEAEKGQNEILVVLDYTQFNCTEDELLLLSLRFPYIHFILFSDQLSRNFLRRMIYGSTNFSVLLKDCSIDETQNCLLKVAQGEQYICQRVIGWLESPEKPENARSPLTSTEKEILKSLSMGHTTKEIANERFLSVYTIMTHRKNIFRKLGVNNAQEAIRYALRAGIVDPMEYYI